MRRHWEMAEGTLKKFATVNANLKMSIFAETGCHFSAVSVEVYTALIHNLTCRLEARQALIYQLVLGLTGENGKYNYSRAVHRYPPFFDIICSAKNYKIGLALTLLLALYLSLQCKIYCTDTRMFRICQAYDVLACGFWIWTQVQQHREIRARAETAAERELWASRKAQYELAKENITLINRKCHDLKHEVAALRSMQDTKLLADSLKSIEQSIQIYDNTIQTGNRVLDTVLTEKSLLCEQEHITWTCMANGTLLDFMDPLELYTLLGNALDNAIEGVRQIERVDQRVISVRLTAKGNCAHLQIENFYQGSLTLVQGLPLSRKPQDGYHGYGLKSIRDIVERNGGSMVIRTEG